MHQGTLRNVGVAGLFLLAGCGGDGSPTGPATGPQTVQVLDGRTESPIASLSGMQATEGQTLHLAAPGFLTLNTVYRGGPILLWPNDAALPLSATYTLVYQGKDPGVLVRWPDGVTQLGLVLDGSLRSTPWALARTEAAAAVVSRTHPAIDVAVGGGVEFVAVSLNPGDQGFVTYPGAAAVAYVRYSDSGVVREARIVVRSLDVDGFWHGEQNFQTAMTHELIHATGLVGHLSPEVKGVMSASADSYSFPEPTPAEVLIMKLHYARLVGTMLVGGAENETAGFVASSGEGTWHLVCAR